MNRHEPPDTCTSPPSRADKISNHQAAGTSVRSAQEVCGALRTPSGGACLRCHQSPRAPLPGGGGEARLSFQGGSEGAFHTHTNGVGKTGCLFAPLAITLPPRAITQKMAYLGGIYPEPHPALRCLQNKYINMLSEPPLCSKSPCASERPGGVPQTSASNPRRELTTPGAGFRWVVSVVVFLMGFSNFYFSHYKDSL